MVVPEQKLSDGQGVKKFIGDEYSRNLRQLGDAVMPDDGALQRFSLQGAEAPAGLNQMQLRRLQKIRRKTGRAQGVTH